MNITSSRRRVGSFLLGGGFAMLVVITLLFPGITPWADAKTPGPGANPPSICTVHYFTFDSPKESKNAFGPPVASRDEASIKAQLNERRLCGKDNLGDPALTAAHYAGWSAEGLTRQKVSFAGIDAFASRLVADHTLWSTTVSEMDSLENASVFSLGSIPAGSPSLYMVPSASGVATRQGVTVGNGTAVVFTHGSAVVKLRLDCGFQNVRASFPGVPSVPPGSPELPKKPVIHKVVINKVVIHKNVCSPNQPHGTFPVCKDSSSRDPQNQGNNKKGGGGLAPVQTDPQGPPAAGHPPVIYTTPPVPAPASTPPVGSTPDPAPAPAPEPAAPAPSAPATGTSCAPGILVC